MFSRVGVIHAMNVGLLPSPQISGIPRCFAPFAGAMYCITRWSDAVVGMCPPNESTKSMVAGRALAYALVQKKTKLYLSPEKGSTACARRPSNKHRALPVSNTSAEHCRSNSSRERVPSSCPQYLRAPPWKLPKAFRTNCCAIVQKQTQNNNAFVTEGPTLLESRCLTYLRADSRTDFLMDSIT